MRSIRSIRFDSAVAIMPFTPKATNPASPAAATTDTNKADATDEFSSSPLCCVRQADESGVRRFRFRCNFLLVFVLIAICQVAVACVLIWYIGYTSTNTTVDRLTTHIRSSVLRNGLFEVNDKLSKPLHAAHSLRYMTQQRFPDFGQRLNVSTEDGWLADIAAVQANYPSVSRVAIINRHQLLAGMLRPYSSSGRAPLSSTGTVVVELVEPNVYGLESATYKQYIARPIRNATYDPPFEMDAEVLGTDSATAIREFMGGVTPFRSFAWNLHVRPFWLAAVEVAAMGRQGGWSDAYWSIFPSVSSEGYWTLAAVSVVTHPITKQLEWFSYALLAAIDLYQILSSLEVGPNGSAYLIRPRGRCVASSRLELTQQIDRDRQDIDMRSSSDEWLNIIYDVAHEWNLVTDVNVTPRNASLVVPYRDTIYERKLSLHGSSWLIQAQMASNTTAGLPFTVVIVTRDDDFNGHINMWQ